MVLSKKIEDFIVQEFNKNKDMNFNDFLENIKNKIKPSVITLYEKDFIKDKEFISKLNIASLKEISKKLLNKEKLTKLDRQEVKNMLKNFLFLRKKYEHFFSEKHKNYLENNQHQSMSWYEYKRFSCNKNHLKEEYQSLIDINFKYSRNGDSYEIINLDNTCNFIIKRNFHNKNCPSFLNFLLKSEELTILIKSEREVLISIDRYTFTLILEENCYKVKLLTNQSDFKYNDYTFIDKENIYIENSKITKRKTEKMFSVSINDEEVLSKVFIKRKNLLGTIIYAKDDLDKNIIFNKYFEREHNIIADSIIENIFDETPVLLETSFLKNILKTKELFSKSDMYNHYTTKTKKEILLKTKNCVCLNIDDKSISLEQIEKMIEINTLI